METKIPPKIETVLIDYPRVFMENLSDTRLVNEFIFGTPLWIDFDDEFERGLVLQGNIHTGAWVIRGGEVFNADETAPIGDRRGDASDFIGLLNRLTKSEAYEYLLKNYGRPLGENQPAPERGYSRGLGLWYVRLANGCLFDDGVFYSFEEMAALKGVSIETLKTVHEIKKIQIQKAQSGWGENGNSAKAA